MARDSKATVEVAEVEVAEVEVAEVEDAVAQFWSTNATLLLKVDGQLHAVTPMASPTCRGNGLDANERFGNAIRNLVASMVNAGIETHGQLRWLRFELLPELAYLHVMVKRSGSQCPCCGIVRTEDALTDWCNEDAKDSDGNSLKIGCGYWRKHPQQTSTKRSSIDIDSILGSLK